ncbi:GNAT family N-acetyltransferase [Rivibacter subsaxonicus]|nr:GNAT family protein [Rivibacter subsaxonicus]
MVAFEAPVGYRVRRLAPADLGAYKALRDEALRLHPDAFTSDHETEVRRGPESYLGRLGSSDPLGGTFLLGAYDAEDRLVAAVGLEREMRAKVRHISWLIGLMVRPEHGGRGLAQALVQACIASARSAPGLELITLSVTASNEVASQRALRVYERAGFERYGLLPRAIRLVDGSGRVEYRDKAQMMLRLR